MEVILVANVRRGRSWIVDFIVLVCLGMLMAFARLVTIAKELEKSQEGNKCPNNHYCIVKFLMFGELISWALFQALSATSTSF